MISGPQHGLWRVWGWGVGGQALYLIVLNMYYWHTLFSQQSWCRTQPRVRTDVKWYFFFTPIAQDVIRRFLVQIPAQSVWTHLAPDAASSVCVSVCLQTGTYHSFCQQVSVNGWIRHCKALWELLKVEKLDKIAAIYHFVWACKRPFSCRLAVIPGEETLQHTAANAPTSWTPCSTDHHVWIPQWRHNQRTVEWTNGNSCALYRSPMKI